MSNAGQAKHQIGRLRPGRDIQWPRQAPLGKTIHCFLSGVASERDPCRIILEQQEIDRTEESMADAANAPILQVVLDYLKSNPGLFSILGIPGGLRRAKPRKGRARRAMA